MRWWKILGLAAFAGVAATGVVIARAERRRRAYTPEEVRERLRIRHAEAVTGSVTEAVDAADTETGPPGTGDQPPR
ncbi:hypothetical protein [Microbispora bryophytorum]|uniref:Secreted protein n=1 Tax=Microbispora bryophytorum subsp. camponoti TaxID=1677852 RepID=A0ABR8L216_9ACTN|nr:hypothetical protein [Microbispora camponoti]MBD3142513.1 hypothetical protein [Microbispora camponoti]